ncbi:2OG-Fe(II) oxygenase family protein [Xanthobacter sediminis]
MSHIQNCAEALARTGFGTIPMTVEMRKNYLLLVDWFLAVTTKIKETYSFSEDTDGFLPFGSEYAHVSDNPDLCERFCYWHTHSNKRQDHPFSQSPYLRAAAAYESEITGLAQQIINGICREFGAPPLASIRDSSYLQLCVYGQNPLPSERQFAQDPHEDGHLLTFIRPNRDGLVILRGSALEPVRLLENELAVLSGSLLTQLSDCAIPATYHAVLVPSQPIQRSSLVYFVNPSSSDAFIGFRRKKPINLLATMNAHHTGFGNCPIAVTSKPA